MGAEKKGVKRFKKGVEKTRQKGGDVSASAKYNKGARSKPRPMEKEMEDYETAENVIQVKKHEKKGTGGVAQHKKDLEKLEEMDPEFFDFLKKNDSKLLDFGIDEDDDDDDEMDSGNDTEDDSDMDNEDEQDVDYSDEEDERVMIPVTQELLTKTMKAAQGGSLAAMKRVMAMFRAACMPYGDDSHTSENLSEGDGQKGLSRYQIPSAAIFEQTLQTVLEGAYKAFYLNLG